MENSSKCPSLLMNTDKRIRTVSIKRDDITSIIKSLNTTLARGFDNILTHMIQFCGDSITFPLAQICKTSLSQGVFPDSWKMVNIIPVT